MNTDWPLDMRITQDMLCASGSCYLIGETGAETFIGLDKFINTNKFTKISEWKCPACSIINSIEATYCGEKHEHAIGCGRPREKTRQDMYE